MKIPLVLHRIIVYLAHYPKQRREFHYVSLKSESVAKGFAL